MRINKYYNKCLAEDFFELFLLQLLSEVNQLWVFGIVFEIVHPQLPLCVYSNTWKSDIDVLKSDKVRLKRLFYNDRQGIKKVAV